MRVQWEVLWIAKGTTHSKEFEHDLASALELHNKLIAGGRAGVTLRSMNMQFPPPDKYADKEDVAIGKRRGIIVYEKQLIVPRVYTILMGGLNARGIWYCPYCIKMRRFKKTDCFVIDGVQVDEPAMSCPMCGASHRLVRKYNPMSARYDRLRATRSDKGRGR